MNPEINVSPSLPDNPKLDAYLNLVIEAEHQFFGRAENGVIFRGLVAGLVRAKIEAHDAGLTPAEIQAAIQIGEYRNPLKANPPLDTNDYTPYNTEEYWEEVYREAEDFWARRCGSGREE
jgi:hypothetical protein